MSAELIVQTASVEETEAFGERLGRVLLSGDFLGFSGDLGAGKTALVRGIARGAGVPAEAGVASPTFAIVNAYKGGRLPLFHADLYRVRDAEELYDAGFYDLLESDGALLVEWIDRVRDVAPEGWLEVVIHKRPPGRHLMLVAHGARAERIVEALRANT